MTRPLGVVAVLVVVLLTVSAPPAGAASEPVPTAGDSGAVGSATAFTYAGTWSSATTVRECDANYLCAPPSAGPTMQFVLQGACDAERGCRLITEAATFPAAVWNGCATARTGAVGYTIGSNVPSFTMTFGGTAGSPTITGTVLGGPVVNSIFKVYELAGATRIASGTTVDGCSPLAPGAPVATAGTIGSGKVSLTWTAIPGAVGYYVKIEKDGVEQVGCPGLGCVAFGNSTVVEGLTTGSSYRFSISVFVNNQSPYGPWSNQVTLTPPVTVDPPTSTPPPPTASNPDSTSVDITSGSTGGGAVAGGRGDPPTGYRIFLYVGSSSTPAQTKDANTTTRKVTFTGLTAGTRYRFKAAAFNEGGQGPSSAYSSFVLLPFLNFDAFTNRQFLDFANRAATTGEKSDWATKLGNGTWTSAQAVSAAVDFSYHQKQSPVTRLFRAYFLRLPDKGGLDYWTGRYRAGLSLNTISQSFASSAEFKQRYGSLGNAAFVDLVYQNVLGRPGEPDGVAYWTGQLNSGAKNRGQVMAGFSESGEYRNKTRAVVDLVNVMTGMLRRVPTGAEETTWAPATNPPTRLALIAFVLASAAYDARV